MPAQASAPEPPRAGRRAGGRSRAARRRATRRRGQHLLVVDRARDGQDDASGPVGRPPVVHDAAMCRATHRADRPGDLAAERMAPVEELVEQREDVVGRRVDVHPDLVDDDRLLGRQVGATQDRVEGELADGMERDAGLLGRHLGAVDRQLAIGAGVDRSADALDDLRQRAGLRVRACP